jgi:hypothetical protein
MIPVFYPIHTNDWFFTVLRPAQEIFTYRNATITGEGLQNFGMYWRSGPLSREGSLSCHTCCDTGPRFFWSRPKERPIHSPLTTHNGLWRIYFNPDPFLRKKFWKQKAYKTAFVSVWKKIGPFPPFLETWSLLIDEIRDHHLESVFRKWVQFIRFFLLYFYGAPLMIYHHTNLQIRLIML